LCPQLELQEKENKVHLVYNSGMPKTKNTSKSTTSANSTKRKLVLPKEGKKIGGVAAAFANYFGLDVTLVRILWVLLLLPGGLPGIIPYLICWLIIPEEK
jgi:phage shock protein PspC (stress-responsive transcriptional regulator)